MSGRRATGTGLGGHSADALVQDSLVNCTVTCQGHRDMEKLAGQCRDDAKAFRAEVVRVQRVLQRHICNLREETRLDHLPSVRNHIGNQIKAVNWVCRHLATCEDLSLAFRAQSHEIQTALNEWSMFLVNEQTRIADAEQLLAYAQRFRAQLSIATLLAGCELLSKQLANLRTRMKAESWSSSDRNEVSDRPSSGGTQEGLAVDQSVQQGDGPVQWPEEQRDGQQS